MRFPAMIPPGLPHKDGGIEQKEGQEILREKLKNPLLTPKERASIIKKLVRLIEDEMDDAFMKLILPTSSKPPMESKSEVGYTKDTMFKMEKSSGESQEKGVNISSLIDEKYQELQKARIMKMELEQERKTSIPEARIREIIADLDHLERVIPQLEQEFEDMKKAKAENLEKRFGDASANDPSMDNPLMEGTNDDYLNRKLG